MLLTKFIWKIFETKKIVSKTTLLLYTITFSSFGKCVYCVDSPRLIRDPSDTCYPQYWALIWSPLKRKNFYILLRYQWWYDVLRRIPAQLLNFESFFFGFLFENRMVRNDTVTSYKFKRIKNMVISFIGAPKKMCY